MSRRLLTLPLRAIAALAILLGAAEPAFAQWAGYPSDNFYAATTASAAGGVAIDIPLNQGQGTAAFTLTGLAASGATVTNEYSDDRGATWAAIRSIGTATAAGATTETADGAFTINASGHTRLRLRVSGAGTGSFTVSANTSVATKEVAISGPVGVAPLSGAAFGVAPVVANGATSLIGKATAANLFGFSITSSTAAGYLALLNASAVPAAGAAIAPLECVPVAASSFVARRQDVSDYYSTGLVAVATTSCTTFTAPSAAPLVISLEVK